jgi:hypothetical protein
MDANQLKFSVKTPIQIEGTHLFGKDRRQGQDSAEDTEGKEKTDRRQG